MKNYYYLLKYKIKKYFWKQELKSYACLYKNGFVFTEGDLYTRDWYTIKMNHALVEYQYCDHLIKQIKWVKSKKYSGKK